MADVKHILVVDDHFEMLEFLRTMLEQSGRDYQVLAVPSAEEGMLELLRTPFDLLITDVRLPGMSGFDLVRRVRRVRKELPVVVISGYGIEQGQKEAAALGVVHYFVKPLDNTLFLKTVQRILHGEPVIEPPPPASDLPPLQLSPALSSTLSQRLQMLRNEISASYITLTSIHSQVLSETGIGVGLITPELLTLIAQSLRSSQAIATHLNNDDVFTMHYQAGSRIELYAMSIGEKHLLLIFFTAESRRGRVGTVWVFAQRFAKEMLPLLTDVGTAPTPAPAAPPSLPTQTVTDLPDFPAKTPTPPVATGSGRKPTPLPTPAPSVPQKPAPVHKPEPTPTPPPTAAAPQPVFSFEDAIRQGLIPGELAPTSGDATNLSPEESLSNWLDLPTPTQPENALDDWLTDAAANEPLSSGEGLSFAEAMQLGLIAGELAPPQGSDDDDLADLFTLSADEAAELDLTGGLEPVDAAAAFSLEQAQTLGLLPDELVGQTRDAEADLADLFKLTPDEAVDLDTFWDTAIAEASDAILPGLSLEEAQAKGVLDAEPTTSDSADLVPADLEALFNTPTDAAFDLDAFWDEAVASEQIAAASQNLSLDEARRKGLIANPTWNQDE